MEEPLTRVVVFTPLFPPAFLGGGPIRTLEALVQEVPDGFSTSVITGSRDLGESEHLDVIVGSWVADGSRARTLYVDVKSVRAVASAFREVRRIGPDVVYLNGFFSMWSTIVPQILMRCFYLRRSRVVLAPRGEFGDAALAIKSPKKRLFLGLYRRLGFAKSVTWHASSADEAADVARVIGPDAHVIVREDDVDLPMVAMPAEPHTGGALRAVHVARLSPIKGLDVLLAGMRDVSAVVSLDIYGPAEDDEYVARCTELVEQLGENITVTFHGSIAHDLVRRVVSGYDVMLFPTHGENFGHVAAESLSVSCPVIAPDTTPWTPVLRDGGGVVLPSNTAEAWAVAVQAYALLKNDGWVARRCLASGAYERWRLQSSQQAHLFSSIAGLNDS